MRKVREFPSRGNGTRDVRAKRMQRFWDARADENALFFVDNRLDYRDPNQQGFWDGGEKDLETLLDALGARVDPTDVVVEIGFGVGRLTRPLAPPVEAGPSA